MLLVKQRQWLIVGGVILLLLLSAGGATGQEDAYPVLDEGPYKVGVQTLTFVDEARGGRELVTEIWYPALEPEDNFLPVKVFRDAEADLSGGPYPLVIMSHPTTVLNGMPVEMSHSVLSHIALSLVSHGFVVAGIAHDCDADPACWIDRPLDVSFSLDQLVALAAAEWAGVIDPENIGLMGAERGAYTVLAAAGAEAQLAEFVAWQQAHHTETTSYYPGYDDIASVLGEVLLYRDMFDATGDIDSWSPVVDERIDAVLTWGATYGQFFGAEGLAAVTVPILLVDGAMDQDYQTGSLFIYEHLGSPERYLITLPDSGGIFFAGNTDCVYHFGPAFFGVTLQGREDYAGYLTEEVLATQVFHSGTNVPLPVIWGGYEEE